MSVVAVRSNTGSTIAIIVTLLGLAAAGIFFGSRALKGFKFPEINFPEIKFPEFKFPSLFPGPGLEDVADLSLIPQGAGIDLGQLKQAFKITFPSGSISRSVLARPILSVGALGVSGKPLGPQAVATRIPTFVGVVDTGSRGPRLIAGSQALFDRIRDNLRRAVPSTPPPPPKLITVVSKSGRCISGCPGGRSQIGTRIAPSTAEQRRRSFRR